MVIWVVVGIGVLVVLGVGVWFLLPSLRALRGPDFEPTYTDDETVFQVQQKGIPGAGE